VREGSPVESDPLRRGGDPCVAGGRDAAVLGQPDDAESGVVVSKPVRDRLRRAFVDDDYLDRHELLRERRSERRASEQPPAVPGRDDD